MRSGPGRGFGLGSRFSGDVAEDTFQSDAAARQRVINDVYGHFFTIAFSKIAESSQNAFRGIDGVILDVTSCRAGVGTVLRDPSARSR